MTQPWNVGGSNAQFYTTITTGNTATLPVVWTGSYTQPGYGVMTSAPAAPATPAAPREPTPLEWLDREIEATCKLARLP